jgi:hypothetical protein
MKWSHIHPSGHWHGLRRGLHSHARTRIYVRRVIARVNKDFCVAFKFSHAPCKQGLCVKRVKHVRTDHPCVKNPSQLGANSNA